MSFVQNTMTRLRRQLQNLLVGAPALESSLFDALVPSMARGLAAGGDQRILLPIGGDRPRSFDGKSLRVVLCGNMANNSYCIARAMRSLGYQVDVLISDQFFDTFVMNRPEWEELEIEAASYDDALSKLPRWTPPAYVRAFGYDQHYGQRFARSFSGVTEASRLYNEKFKRTLPGDMALLLAQIMGHWPYISALGDYDVAVFMGAPIMLAPFCPIPYAVYPLGGDRFITAFEENLPGFLTRAGFRRSSAVLMSAPNFREWYDRLGVIDRCEMNDYFIDTDVYGPGDEGGLRSEWGRRIGGDFYIVSTCRQSWEYKGNDVLFRAFARLAERQPGIRLVLTEWGDDVEKSKSLVSELNIDSKVLWLPLGSKPIVARRQRAADVIVDQLSMASFGTCIMESMAAAKPVIARYEAPDMPAEQYEPPPILSASTEQSVLSRLEQCLDTAFKIDRGKASRDWMLKWCSHHTKASKMIDQLEAMVWRARGQ